MRVITQLTPSMEESTRDCFERLREADLRLLEGPWWLVPSVQGRRGREKTPAQNWRHLITQEVPTHQSLPISENQNGLIRPYLAVLRHHCVFDIDIQGQKRGNVSRIDLVEALIHYFPGVFGLNVISKIPAIVFTPSGGLHFWWKKAENFQQPQSHRWLGRSTILSLDDLPPCFIDLGVSQIQFLSSGLVMAPGSIISTGRYILSAASIYQNRIQLPTINSVGEAYALFNRTLQSNEEATVQ